jgi:maltooligosyltrehalose trehalohydrolase
MTKSGSSYKTGNGCHFCVWAPLKEEVLLHIVYPNERKMEMKKDKSGYFHIHLDDALPGWRYYFSFNSSDYPDPASHYQPEGVFGPSEIINHCAFQWTDAAWRGLPFKDLIIYELHTGTFTSEGTFEVITDRLDDLIKTGVNTIELMPVSQFPGERNWGYDGVFPYAVQNSYGGPEGLKKLVNVCHQKGMAVFLDVVYNHLGPEGNIFKQFGPYFTDRYKSPWGEAINFDGEYSDGVRDYFLNNALYWFDEFHIDGLRLDAIHTIYDTSAVPFWQLLNTTTLQNQQRLGRTLHLIAESDLNSPHVVQPRETNGFGFTAQWLDDFHHALYVHLNPKGKELYADYVRMDQLAKAYTDGFVLSGEYVEFRKKKFGASSAGIAGNHFVVFIDNHDQAGNRPGGERLSMLISFNRLRLGAAALFLSPYIPMLFMGEEYGEQNPFLFFTSYKDKDLIEAVRKGRKEQLSRFNYQEELADPQDESSFEKSKLNWMLRQKKENHQLLEWYRQLITLRRKKEELQNFNKNDIHVYPINQSGFVLHRQCEGGTAHLLALFNLTDNEINYMMPPFSSTWHLLLNSKNGDPDSKENSYSLSSQVFAGEQIKLSSLSVSVYCDNLDELQTQ